MEEWIRPEKTNGLLNDKVKIWADYHYGRNERKTTLTVQNQGGSKPSRNIQITQQGEMMWVDIDISERDLTSDMKLYEIYGYSNSKSLKAGDFWIYHPEYGRIQFNDIVSVVDIKLYINDELMTSYIDCTIPNDIGATNRYKFSYHVEIWGYEIQEMMIAEFHIIDQDNYDWKYEFRVQP